MVIRTIVQLQEGERVEKTAEEIAEAILELFGGDPGSDTSFVSMQMFTTSTVGVNEPPVAAE